MSIVIKDHKDSLESIQMDGRVVYIIGPGALKSPGHPAGNQQIHRQLVIFNIASTRPFLFKIYNKDLNNHTKYLGDYRMIDYKIKLSFEGFRYFEYKLLRVKSFSSSIIE